MGFLALLPIFLAEGNLEEFYAILRGQESCIKLFISAYKD